MQKTLVEIEKIPVHFILCTERTGSSLLSLMLNLHPKVICTSEELFAIYFHKKYKDKITWSEKELRNYINEFWLMAEQDIDLYFTTKEKFYEALSPFKENLNYKDLLKLTYLQFIEPKPKDKIEVIVDKQIKYLFHIPLLLKIFPDAKFIILTRDVRDNIVSKMKRELNLNPDPFFLSSLWFYTYSGVNHLIESKKSIHIIQYEDLVGNTENEIKLLCQFLGIEYDPSLIKTAGVYETYLENRKEFLKPEEYERIKKFNSELLTQVNTSKIGTFKSVLNPVTEQKILKQNKELLNYFGYRTEEAKVKFSLADRWNWFMAYLYRPFLLNLYFNIPFSIKLMIKKIKK